MKLGYSEIHRQCEEAGILLDSGRCALARFYKCNGYQCPSVHWHRGTRPSKILDSYGLEDQYTEEMG